ncbi:MAG: NAD(P)/FAD-dependent oxidoreductase, partial [Deltaproteobacteria bacterium]|nr:NAD(P)/FAD-dependent oxidoreductase [Deltaproteobacteria bacterium]
MDCVIVGGGIGGFEAAFTCLKLWPQKSVTLIDAEQEIGYYRTLLPQFMAGTLTEEKLFFWHPQDYPKLMVQSGTKVISLNRSKRQLHLQDGRIVQFERLILSCGGRPIIPAVFREKT